MRRYPVRRNTVLLAACLALTSGVAQLVVAVATVTLVLATGVESILGLGPAIFLTFGALAAFPAGRAMDRLGRMPVIAAGFAIGAAGCSLTALGCAVDSAALVMLGFAGFGTMQGSVLLARSAAADMVDEPKKARAISLTLFGALVGAAFGPLVFRPMFAGKELDLDALVVPWLVAAGIAATGIVVSLLVRPDPRSIALELSSERASSADEQGGTPRPAPLRDILRRPGVALSVLGGLTSFGVMVGVMTLSGHVVLGRGHPQTDVFTVISAHIVGMYGLVLVVGELVDRIGRHTSLVGGLLIMAFANAMLAWVDSVLWMSVSLFLLGLGWNISYVAATAELVTRAGPVERGRLVGFTDLTAGLFGASLALVGGAAYSEWGAAAVGVGGTVAVVGPALVLLARRPPEPVVEPAG